MAIIYHSIHHHNTEAIARAMADQTGATLLPLNEVLHNGLGSWDLIGIGSGIYFGRHHKQLFRFIREEANLPSYGFVYCTAGIRTLGRLWNLPLIRSLKKKNVVVLGQFCAAGWDTFGPLKLMGGLHRGRPHRKDLQRAGRFAQTMLEHFQHLRTKETH